MLDDSNNERLKRNTDTPLASIRKCGGCIQLAIRKKREAWSVYAISGDRSCIISLAKTFTDTGRGARMHVLAVNFGSRRAAYTRSYESRNGRREQLRPPFRKLRNEDIQRLRVVRVRSRLIIE